VSRAKKRRVRVLATKTMPASSPDPNVERRRALLGWAFRDNRLCRLSDHGIAVTDFVTDDPPS